MKNTLRTLGVNIKTLLHVYLVNYNMSKFEFKILTILNSNNGKLYQASKRIYLLHLIIHNILEPMVKWPSL
jgi:hypothetical protein